LLSRYLLIYFLHRVHFVLVTCSGCSKLPQTVQKYFRVIIMYMLQNDFIFSGKTHQPGPYAGAVDLLILV
jgi:hypothetical protein